MKKGNDTINFEAREFIRMIDELSSGKMLNNWISLNGKNKGSFKVLVNYFTENNIFNDEINDHKILDSALSLQKEEKNKSIILVSKDINLRLKAKSLNLKAEDYKTGKIKNLNSLEFESQTIKNIKDEIIDNFYINSSISKKKFFRERNYQTMDIMCLKVQKNQLLLIMKVKMN